MDTEKLIQDFLAIQTNNWLQEDAPLIEAVFQQNITQLISNLTQTISQILQQAQSLEQTGKKGVATYICISFLHTNAMRDIWQYRLDVYDEKFLFDQTECSCTWEANFAFDFLKTRLENLNQEIRRSIYANKVRPHHLNNIKMTMGLQYHFFASFLLKNIIFDAAYALQEDYNIETSRLKITMGEYKDMNILLYGSKDD